MRVSSCSASVALSYSQTPRWPGRNPRAANGSRSSTLSPTPMKWTGSPNLRGDRHQDAAARRAVELGHHQAGDAGDVAEDLDLVEGRSGRSWRRASAARHAARPASSFLMTRTIFSSSAISSALFCRRPAVSMSRTSAPLCSRLLERIEGEAGGIGALRPRDDRRAGALPQIFELLDGGGPERVAGGEHHLRPSRAEAWPRACRWSWSCPSR